MKKFFDWAATYIAESDWKDLGMLKACLCSMGIMIGMMIPKKKRLWPFLIAATVFIVTYLPLMLKFLEIAKRDNIERSAG